MNKPHNFTPEVNFKMEAATICNHINQSDRNTAHIFGHYSGSHVFGPSLIQHLISYFTSAKRIALDSLTGYISTDAGSEHTACGTFIGDCTCQVKWSFTSQCHRRSIGHYDSLNVSPFVTLFIAVIMGSWTIQHITRTKRSRLSIRCDANVSFTTYKQHTVDTKWGLFQWNLQAPNLCFGSPVIID